MCKGYLKGTEEKRQIWELTGISIESITSHTIEYQHFKQVSGEDSCISMGVNGINSRESVAESPR